MKKILSILVLFAILMTACSTVKENKASMQIQTPATTITAKEKNFESEVRLTAEGFDAAQLNLKKGESLIVIIADDDVNGHYLALNGNRISAKELYKGDKADIPFDGEGTYNIVDETSGYSLLVNVE